MKIKSESGIDDNEEDDEDEDFDDSLLDFVSNYSSQPGFGNYSLPSVSDGSKRLRMQNNPSVDVDGQSTASLNPTQHLSKNAEQARLNRLKKKEESFQRKSLLSNLHNSVKQCEFSKNNLETTLKNQRSYNLYLKHLLSNKSNLQRALQNLPHVSRIYARGFILPNNLSEQDLPTDSETPLCLHITGSTAQIDLCKDCSEKFRSSNI